MRADSKHRPVARSAAAPATAVRPRQPCPWGPPPANCRVCQVEGECEAHNESMHAQNRGKGEGGCKQQLWALQPALPFDQDEFNFFLVKFSGNFHKMLRRLLSNPAAEESGEEQKEYVSAFFLPVPESRFHPFFKVLLSKMQPGPADPFNSFPAAFPAYDGHGQASVCWPHQQLPMDAAPLLPSLALTERDFYWPK